MNITIHWPDHHDNGHHHTTYLLRFVEAALGASGLDLENSVDGGKRTRGEPLVVQLVPAEDKSESDQKSESGNRRNACCSVRSHLGGDDDTEEDDGNHDDGDHLVARANMM